MQQQRVGDIHVLVLDDHRFMQQVMRLMLGSLGIRRVVTANTVDDAMAILSAEPTDVVIADYRLGDETGADFLRLARASHGGTRFVPVIGCTADTSPATIAELRDAGADEILAKPVSAKIIWAKLMAVTNARRPFVTAPNFFGPDRRRRKVDTAKRQNRRAADTEVEI